MMKADTLIVIAAAGVGLYLVSRMVSQSNTVQSLGPLKTGAASLNNGGNAPAFLIDNTALPGQAGWAWKYYSDGTAISPTGDYYLNGQLMYRAGSS